MSRTITTDESDAIFADARLCRDDLAGEFDGTIVPDRVWFALFLRRVWPVKADAAVMQYARCADRTARAYTSGDRIPSATVLRDLLHGDEGDVVLDELMVGATAAWWAIRQRERKLAALALVIFGQLGEIVRK